MPTKLPIKVELRTLMVVAGMLTTSTINACAEPPHLANYWKPTRLSMHACVQRGMTVLRQIGFADAHLRRSGKVVFGNNGESHMAVICAIPGWVVFAGASPSLDEIANYRNELASRF
jgi:hypothetical protein